MKIFTIDGNHYRLPNGLNPLQLELYVHLSNWKWQYILRAAQRHADTALDRWNLWYRGLDNL